MVSRFANAGSFYQKGIRISARLRFRIAWRVLIEEGWESHATVLGSLGDLSDYLR